MGELSFTARSLGEGPAVICMHGFPDDAGSFRHQLPALAGAGYRALSVSLRGYEPSSQPADGSYFLVDLVDDLRGWIDALGLERVRVIGHDWGAIIAYAAAAAMPERISSMVTIAVPHIRRFLPALPVVLPTQLWRSWYVMFFQLRRISSAYFSEDRGLIDKLWRDWSPGWTPEPEAYAEVKQTFAQPGVREAALAYYRALFGTVLDPRARASWALFQAKTPVPTLVVTGARDGCADTRMFDHGDWREDFLGPAELIRVAGAGHFVHQERPEIVNPAILDWLAQPSSC